MFDLKTWQTQLASMVERWEDDLLNKSEEFFNAVTARSNDSIKTMLQQGYKNGLRITKFHGAHHMSWMNAAFRFHSRTGLAPEFFTDDSKTPEITPRRLYSLHKAVRQQHRNLMMRTLDHQATLNTCLFIALGWLNYFANCSDDPEAIEFELFCVRWITLPRTQEEQLSIVQPKCECPPHVRGNEYHTAGQDSYKSSNERLLDYCMKAFHRSPWTKNPPLDLSQPIPTRSRSSTGRRHRNMSKILPHGPEHTTRALLEWLNTRPSPPVLASTMQALCNLLLACYPIIIPYVICSPTFVKHGIGRTASFYASISDAGHKRRWDDANTSIEAGTRGLMLLLNSAIFHFCSRYELNTFQSNYCRELVFSYEQIFLSAESIEQPRTATPENPILEHEYTLREQARQIKMGVNMLGGQLYRDCAELGTWPVGLRASSDKAHYAFSAFAQHLRWDDEDAIWLHAMETIDYLHKCKRCCYSGCTKTSFDKKLWLCAGCMQVQYCSRLCQKRAWKSTRWSHRDVCDEIRNLCLQYKVARGSARKTLRPASSTGELALLKKEVTRLASLSRHIDGLFEMQAKKTKISSEDQWRSQILHERQKSGSITQR